MEVPAGQGILSLSRRQEPEPGGHTREVDANSTVRVKVEAGGGQIVAHVGLHALGAFADRLGLGDSLSSRISITGERLPLHDRGKVLVQARLMLAGGGEACSDIEAYVPRGSCSAPCRRTRRCTARCGPLTSRLWRGCGGGGRGAGGGVLAYLRTQVGRTAGLLSSATTCLTVLVRPLAVAFGEVPLSTSLSRCRSLSSPAIRSYDGES